jgi:hypothetical protein
MSKRSRIRNREDHTFTAFGSAAIAGIGVVALVEDLCYFAADSPESFWRSWHIHPVSMFAGSVAYVAILYLLQLLNDPDHAIGYLYPYLLLVGVTGTDLAVQLNPTWVAVAAFASIGWSVFQVRSSRNRRSGSARV